jgi:hypothetical protein
MHEDSTRASHSNTRPSRSRARFTNASTSTPAGGCGTGLPWRKPRRERAPGAGRRDEDAVTATANAARSGARGDSQRTSGRRTKERQASTSRCRSEVPSEPALQFPAQQQGFCFGRAPVALSGISPFSLATELQLGRWWLWGLLNAGDPVSGAPSFSLLTRPRAPPGVVAVARGCWCGGDAVGGGAVGVCCLCSG